MTILFVCLGNICRSPAAEAVARRHGLTCDSAGTAGWHVGKAPYGPMQQAARARGIEMSDLRARQMTAEDFARASRIIVMDAQNAEDVEALRPPGDTTPVALLTAYGPGPEDHVPDPYYTRDFEGALDLIEARIAALARAL